MKAKTGTAPVNNTRLYYEIAGVGQPLVFIHGFALDTRTWDEQFTYFSQFFKVVRYDLRGFGKSAQPTAQPYSHASDLKALLDYLDIPSAHILGLSRGGRWAIEFAISYKNITDALVVVNGMPNGFRSKEERVSVSSQIVNIAKTEGVAAAKEVWFRHPLFTNARRIPSVCKRLWAMISDYSGWHWVNKDPVQFNKPPASQIVKDITVPTLIVTGEYDVVEFQDAADLLKKQIPQSHKKTLAEVGHLPNMENPNQFNRSLLSFLMTLT